MASMVCFLLAICWYAEVVIAQQNGDIRLQGGDVVSEGRVEVYYAGQWGTVCDDRFSIVDAEVVCRELGFDSASRAISRAGFGRGSGMIWMDGLECTGQEDRLQDCRFNGWGINDCSHREDVGVQCKHTIELRPDIEVRLSCPPSSANTNGDCNVCYDKKPGCPSSLDTNNGVKGIVEVEIEDKWYPLSGKSWDFANAQVVCSQLGYPTAFPIPGLKKLWPSVDTHFCYRRFAANARCSDGFNYKSNLHKTALDDLKCVGAEHNISRCYFNSSLPITTLTTEDVATIHCGYSTENSEHCYGEDLSKEVYRLRGGPAAHLGRVEVRKNGVWGTICDIEWGYADASIVCRNLGYGSAKYVYDRSHFGRGINSVHYSGLKCGSQDQLLSQCESATGSSLTRQINSLCRSHSGDAGVECRIPSETCSDNTLMSKVTGYNNYAEVNGVFGFGRICAGTLDINGATVMCRESQVLFARSYSSEKLESSYNGLIYDGKITCTGDESSLADCTAIQLSNVTTCNDGVVTVTCTANLPDLVPILSQFQDSLGLYPFTSAVPVYYMQCAIEEKCVASSSLNKAPHEILYLLRFDSLTMNYGTVSFEPKQDRSQWTWHSCHNHYHSYENFITYDVLNTLGVEVAEGHKASFCLEDSRCDYGANPSYRCGSRQGISVNCGDLYARHLDCQWIDVTDVGNGEYLLRQTVNADRFTPETDYKNNEIECPIRIVGRRIILNGECKHSDH